MNLIVCEVHTISGKYYVCKHWTLRSINIPQCNAMETTTKTQQTTADSNKCSSGITSNVITLQFKFLMVAV